MPSNKRRKLDIVSESKGLSAFAARRQLQEVAESSLVADNSKRENLNDLDSVRLFDGSLVEPASAAALLLRSGLESGPKGGNANGVGEDDEMSDSPYEEEGSVEIVTESKSREVEPGDIAVQPSINLSNLKPSKANITRANDRSLMIKLSAGERLVLLGEYGLSVIKGQITIMGATISASNILYSVYALASHSLPVIRYLASDDTQAEIRIYQQSTGLRNLRHLSPLFGKLSQDGFNRRSSDEDDGISLCNISNSSFKLLFSTEDAPRGTVVNPIVSSPEWNEILSISASGKLQNNKPSTTMICGPKSSGKSTFARLLTNRLLSFGNTLVNNYMSKSKRPKSGGVAFLDLDPGQPEYSTPGHLSLVYLSQLNLGPPYSHPTPLKGSHEVVRAHSIAALSPATDPVLYMTCVRELLGHYRSMLSIDPKCPLIINTPGWVLGTGLEILVDLIKAAHPTEIIYMSQKGPASVVTALRDASNTTPVLTLPSQITEYTARTAAHLRNMQLMSYFHTQPEKQGNSLWNAEPLSSLPPWEVGFGGTALGILGILSMGEQPPPNMLKETIDGGLLSIVVLDDIAAVIRMQSEADGGSNTAMIINTPEGIPYFNPEVATSLDPNYSYTIGLALVRGIDLERQKLQLLSPISAKDIQQIKDDGKVIVLVSGKLDTPGWAYTEDLYRESTTHKTRSRQEITNGTDDESDDAVDSEDDGNDSMAGVSKDGCAQAPWVEKLRGDRGRGVGARVWRVRRDLGKRGDNGG